ncbi:MAG: hypothetical protein WA793_01635, partial [Sphingorhabdus sp.]|uniref:hypothetical protein n=1 Tax=Sphingorhabdus sp. TaxID=1902408 RepID=UPI003C937B75
MNPLLLMNCINVGPPLPLSAKPEAARTAEFDAELTAALKLGDEATEQTEPQTLDAAIDENPIDSSITVAVELVRVLPAPTSPDDTAIMPIEPPKQEQSPATQSFSAPPVPDSSLSFGFPAAPLIQQPQAHTLRAAAPATHALPIGFAQPEIAQPVEAKVATALPPSEATSVSMSFETVLAPAISAPPPVAKLETANPPLDLQA